MKVMVGGGGALSDPLLYQLRALDEVMRVFGLQHSTVVMNELCKGVPGNCPLLNWLLGNI